MAIIEDLQDIAQYKVDLIVEVCHSTIVKQFGQFFLQFADLLVRIIVNAVLLIHVIF